MMVAQQIKKLATCMDPEKPSPDSTSYAIPSQLNQSYCPQTHFNIILLFTFTALRHILILYFFLHLCLKQPQDSRHQRGDMNQVPY
jgi:hypothetical protein